MYSMSISIPQLHLHDTVLYLSISRYLSPISLYYNTIYLPICGAHLPLHTPIYTPTHLTIYPSFLQSIHPFIYLSIHLYLFICLHLPISSCTSPPLSISLSLSLSLSASPCLSVYFCASLFTSGLFSFSLFLFGSSLQLSLSLPLPFYVQYTYLFLYLYLYLDFCIGLSLSLSITMFMSMLIFVSISISISIYTSLSISISMSTPISVSISTSISCLYSCTGFGTAESIAEIQYESYTSQHVFSTFTKRTATLFVTKGDYANYFVPLECQVSQGSVCLCQQVGPRSLQNYAAPHLSTTLVKQYPVACWGSIVNGNSLRLLAFMRRDTHVPLSNISKTLKNRNKPFKPFSNSIYSKNFNFMRREI